MILLILGKEGFLLKKISYITIRVDLWVLIK